MVPFLLNAQEIKDDKQTYDEAIVLLNVIESSSLIEKSDNVNLNTDYLTTYNGEIELKKVRKSIRITFTRCHPSDYYKLSKQSKLDNSLRINREVNIQNSKLFEYMCDQLTKNPNIKHIHIVVKPKNGITYICVDYHKL